MRNDTEIRHLTTEGERLRTWMDEELEEGFLVDDWAGEKNYGQDARILRRDRTYIKAIFKNCPSGWKVPVTMHHGLTDWTKKTAVPFLGPVTGCGETPLVWGEGGFGLHRKAFRVAVGAVVETLSMSVIVDRVRQSALNLMDDEGIVYDRCCSVMGTEGDGYEIQLADGKTLRILVSY